MNKQIKEILSHLSIIVFFILVSYTYFSPILDGKVIRQMDYEHAKGVAEEANTYHQNEKRDIGWTNSLFGGMPSYQVGGIGSKSVFTPIRRFFTHTLPYATVSTLFVYLLGFYILLLAFKVNKWLSTIGALAFALSSYNIIIIAAGHVTKTYAIGFMPVVLAGFILLYDRKYWLGIILAMLGLGLQISTGHIQIVYYTGLTVGLYVIFKFFWDLKDKKLKDFSIASAISVGIVALVFLANIGMIWRTNEIGKYSIRGKSELTLNKDPKQSGGLDKDYALAWSNGIGETFSIMIPNVKGGASGQIGNNEIAEQQITGQYKDFVKQLGSYWGDQPFTAGPVYFGAIMIFLFVLGLFIVKDKIKWWLLAATVLSILLSWGSNFEPLTNFLFYNLPYYNKFRTVSMSLVIANVTVIFLAFLTLKEILEQPSIIKENKAKFGIAFGLTGGLSLIFWLIPTLFSFTGSGDTYVIDYLNSQGATQDIINSIMGDLEAARIAVFKADAIRSFAFILVTAAILYIFSLSKNFAKTILVGLIGVLVIVDMWTIDRRYLNNDDFISKRKAKTVFSPSPVDQFILKDSDIDYRVFNVGDPFNDAYTSYYHKSIGGYHGAKLRRYQDVIDYYLAPYNQHIVAALQDTLVDPVQLLPSMDVLNMLNAKYIIYSKQYMPILNINAFGNAWFVDKFKFVESPDDELKALNEVDLSRTAVVNKNKFNVTNLSELVYTNDSTKSVVLTEYEPDKLKYKVVSQNGGFVVFSEIYYPEGWKATIDGKPTKIFQTNYILRGIEVPAGSHQVTFEFRPKSIYTAKKIELISSILVILILLGSLYKIYVSCIKNKTEDSEETESKK